MSICLSFFTEPSILGGVFGFQMNIWLGTWLGKIGTGLLLFFSLSAFIVAKFNPTLFRKKSSEKTRGKKLKRKQKLKRIVTKESFEEEKKKKFLNLFYLVMMNLLHQLILNQRMQSTEEDGL